MPTPLSAFDEYVVDGVIGHGGSAVVLRAHHAETPELPVALKVLDSRHDDPGHVSLLLREFEFASRAAHPHVVAMYECGPGWLAMELVEGGTVSTLDDRQDRLAALAQVAAALDHAHDLGIVHCDVKPTNILVTDPFAERGALLSDFGIAREVAGELAYPPAHVEASLPYVAPEVLRGHAPSAASDEYALACTAVEMLTGAPPFRAATSMAMVDAHLNGRIQMYSHRFDWIPRAFDSILAKALAKSPELRYQSCAEFVRLITRVVR